MRNLLVTTGKAIAFALLFVWLPNGKAGAVTFTKIADTNTTVSGTTGNFISFSAPTISGQNVSFQGSTAGLPAQPNQPGVYSYINGSLNTIADTNTSAPGGTGNFSSFLSTPTISGNNVAFLGTDSVGNQGIYTKIGGGALNVVANQSIPVPGGTGNFQPNLFKAPTISGQNVAFLGTDSSGQQGIYTNSGGTLNVVANENTAIPGGAGNFNSFLSPTISNQNVAFVGSDSSNNQAIYTKIGSSLQAPVNQNTTVPGGTGTFTSLLSPEINGQNFAFEGVDSSGQTGIYTDIGGSLTQVANFNTLIPGTTNNFATLSNFSFDGQNVAFLGSDSSGNQGLYANSGGALTKVIDVTSPLSGKTLTSLDISKQGLSGNSVAFLANFTDGSSGIFNAVISGATAASVPEPSSGLGLLAFGALGVGLVLKRHRN